jgi:hypothetical protein
MSQRGIWAVVAAACAGEEPANQANAIDADPSKAERRSMAFPACGRRLQEIWLAELGEGLLLRSSGSAAGAKANTQSINAQQTKMHAPRLTLLDTMSGLDPSFMSEPCVSDFDQVF